MLVDPCANRNPTLNQAKTLDSSICCKSIKKHNCFGVQCRIIHVNPFRVRIHDVATGRQLTEVEKPRTAFVEFSPCNTIMATWEPYMGMNFILMQ